MSLDPFDTYVERMARDVNKAKRQGKIGFPINYVIAPVRKADPSPPLARMIQGGQGGEVRLKIYMCITMMATRKPFDIRSPLSPRGWCDLLGLDKTNGPRRVSQAMKWLENNASLRLAHRSAGPDSILLRSALGDGSPYARPTPSERYVGLPAEFWSNGWILELSPVAIAVFLALLEFQGGQPVHRPGQFIPTDRKARYGLSNDSWTKARHELEEHDLITVGRELIGGDHHFYRKRNTYKAHLDRLKELPATTPRFLDRQQKAI